MNFEVVSTILKANWAIDPQFAISNLPLIKDILSSKLIIEPSNITPHKAVILGSGGAMQASPISGAQKNSFALVHLNGTLLKSDQACGNMGMASIGELIKSLDQNPNIDGICLVIDSPGGTVDGTETLANIIRATQKPIVTFVDGLMASAALWIGLAADHVVASNDHAQIGSVGVLMSFTDLQPAYEKEGVNFHTITAPQSTEKVKMWEDLRAGKYDNYKNEILLPLAERFISTVKGFRPEAKQEHLKGKVFFAKDVLGVFADQIGDLNAALTHLSSLTNDNSSNNKSNTSQMNKESFSAIDKIVGSELVVAEDGAHINLDILGRINTALEALATEPDKTLQASLDLSQKDLTEANELIATQATEIATLKGKPADTTAVAVATKDKPSTSVDKNVSSDDKSFMENLNAVQTEFSN